MTPAIMIAGTGSGVGKSVLVAGFCRLLARRGVSVCPFKAQNMALNSGVTPDGYEMGRAQIVQAIAAGRVPDVRMNPVLLKPQGKGTSQVVLMGRPSGNLSARGYYTRSAEHFAVVKQAYAELAQSADVMVIEGAGSPAEINLQDTDIVNMAMAAHAGADVFIAADIDRGGVFAWMKGTFDLIRDEHKPLVKGFIINRFRGDVSLLEPGISQFAGICPVPVVGVVPWLDIDIDAEDSQDLKNTDTPDAVMRIAVIRLPSVSNFTDLAPLGRVPGVAVRFVRTPGELAGADAVIIPGSKATVADLSFLSSSGLSEAIASMRGRVPVFGICGGFQMMGRHVADPDGIEGEPGNAPGLGFFDMDTVMGSAKSLRHGHFDGAGPLAGQIIEGYEIHMGVTRITDGAVVDMVSDPGLFIGRPEEKLFGTYLHGCFDAPAVAELLFASAGKNIRADYDVAAERMAALDTVADAIEEHCDVGRIIPFLD